ncbi:D-alanyl-D-alanine carboxypeptidase [Clostridium bowmanii]|uniref:D-alanyl-D-alanine carboxypeptidase family protein n=1 Tax=Clostridium bowmanii TaxID=132925 RepID=UPI001C0C773F|nr:D-alanyl-D-alanine carboxypeptidase family protein [Clostridium bowmanii]MBU3189461.1 D-alanyl-D-alanine carboxypeptidase [Clostridium bowmanii]MCA1074076.1 D-alanyl-D-alanine carboxypeptidase [Clostridium bowmanii]
MKRTNRLLLFALVFTLVFSTTAFAAVKPLELIGKAAISVDIDTNEIIYTKNIDNKMYPASITKLITALLLAENKKTTDNLNYTKNAKEQPAFSYNVNVHPVAIGDTMSADNVMDGLLLYSGNDIAYMIADNVGGTPTNFAKMMNEKAAKLGMKGSHFLTPNGLDDINDEHYTTPYDLTLLGRAAYKNEWVKKSMGKKTSTIKSANGPVAIVENRNKLLGVDGNLGGKTGYTLKAGRCLISIYERNGHHILGVVMNSENDAKDTKVFEDMQKLIDWSYASKKEVRSKKNTAIKTISVPYKVIPFIGPERTINVPLESKEDVAFYNNDIKPQTTIKVSGINPWKLDKDTSVGTLELKQRDVSKSIKLYPMISKSTLIKDNIIIYAGIAILLIVVIVLILLLISSINRRKHRGGRRGRY